MIDTRANIVLLFSLYKLTAKMYKQSITIEILLKHNSTADYNIMILEL